MPVVNYFSVDNQLLGEQAGSGAGARTDYLTDALGSVTATTDQGSQVKNTYRYKPYGDLMAKSGASTDPVFKWVGSQGYKYTARKYSDVYIRARHYNSKAGRWTTTDPAWILSSEYAYVWNQVCTYIDRDGNYPQQKGQNPLQPRQIPRPKPRERPYDKQSCQDVFAQAKNALSKCFSSKADPKLVDRLASIMQCIAFGESDCNKTDDGGPFGLFQLSCIQYNKCAPAGCVPCKSTGKGSSNGDPSNKGCGIFESGCNTQAAVAMMIYYLFQSSDSLGDSMCPQYGVLPCKKPKRPNPDNPKTMACLAGKGIDIFKEPIPKPKGESCHKCSGPPVQ